MGLPDFSGHLRLPLFLQTLKLSLIPEIKTRNLILLVLCPNPPSKQNKPKQESE